MVDLVVYSVQVEEVDCMRDLRLRISRIVQATSLKDTNDIHVNRRIRLNSLQMSQNKSFDH